MRRTIRTAALVTCLMATPLGGVASAVSVEDLFHLKANGLSDEVLIALVETDGSVFHLSADDVVLLYQRGLGEKVILAMIATGRQAQRPPVPGSVRVDAMPAMPGHFGAPVIAVPAVHQSIVQHVEAPAASPAVIVGVPVAVPVFTHPARRPRPAEPVYWGHGGALRRDAWQPAPTHPVAHRDPPPAAHEKPAAAEPARRRR
jgi:hypothetical protein